MPANLQITIDDKGLAERMGQFPERSTAAIARVVDRENAITVGKIIEKRLSFPRNQPATLEGLRVQSSRLRRSVRAERATIQGNEVNAAIGSNVRYAGVHEAGFSGTVHVPGYSRRQVIKRSFKFGGAARSRQTQGRDIFVRAHSRRVTFPARRPIGRTLEERLPEYKEAIENALALVLRP
jgi:phage gpG-like protein